MNKQLLEVVCCPACHGQLELAVIERNGKMLRGPALSSCNDEVVGGLMQCACGILYPIIDGVPRLLDGGLAAYPEILERYEAEVRTKIHTESLLPSMPDRKKDDYDHIRRSFTKEWDLFDHAKDKTWGWELAERKKVFLNDVALTENQLIGKRVLDAGCGNGALTAALSTFGMELVGIDLNDGLGVANRNRHRYAGERWANVHFVQGNLCEPPLKADSFDLIYCSGVIHHTPNSRETFRQLVPLVRKGGRLYVWVYGKRHFLVRLFLNCGRQLKKFMSLESLLRICRMMAPFYKVGTELLSALDVMEFRKRSAREITLDLFDAFAPQYNHCHTKGEIIGWFREESFTNIAVSGKQKHGFGVYADKLEIINAPCPSFQGGSS
jgi:2-polyprenyl-3-methyl-5-hydroxy-6-metoxy-1,4-benzoquinol methylase/uncharacterized protein YbaR (Trm112 family)